MYVLQCPWARQAGNVPSAPKAGRTSSTEQPQGRAVPWKGHGCPEGMSWKAVASNNTETRAAPAGHVHQPFTTTAITVLHHSLNIIIAAMAAPSLYPVAQARRVPAQRTVSSIINPAQMEYPCNRHAATPSHEAQFSYELLFEVTPRLMPSHASTIRKEPTLRRLLSGAPIELRAAPTTSAYSQPPPVPTR